MKAWQVLVLIMILGLGLRVWFNLTSGHIFHPDEVFQTLEPAFKLVYGYGIEPWDYTYGLRSYITPYFLATLLYFLKILGLTNPVGYTLGIKLILSIFSLIMIPATYLLTQHLTKNSKAALLAGFFCAVWYETVYFSGRALTEVFATYLFSGAVILLLWKKPKFMFGGCLLTLGCLLRPQYFLIPLILVAYYRNLLSIPKIKNPLLFGILLALLLYALIDYITLGFPFISLINNLRLSFLSGISQAFGISPWYYYFQTVIITSFGLIILSFLILGKYNARLLYTTYLSIIFTHSLITHKEYRFIFVLIPIFLILLSITIYGNKVINSTRKQKALILFTLLISILGVMGKLPYQYLIYRFTPLAKDPLLSLTSSAASNHGCGLFLPDRGWVTSGGYYYLGKNIPLYTFDYPPPSSNSANLALIPSAKNPERFTYLTPTGPQSLPGYIPLSSPSLSCNINSAYSFNRSFDYLKPFLLYAKTY